MLIHLVAGVRFGADGRAATGGTNKCHMDSRIFEGGPNRFMLKVIEADRAAGKNMLFNIEKSDSSGFETINGGANAMFVYPVDDERVVSVASQSQLLFA